MTYRARSEGEALDDATEIEADDPEAAAELYVEHLCDGDGYYYKTNPHIIIITIPDDTELTMQVDIDFSPSFSACKL